MKIVILGAKGMLGKALLEEFKTDCEVLAFDKQNLDVTNKNNVKIKFEEIKPDFVINATAYNSVDKIEENVADYNLAGQVNGYAVGDLAQICQSLNIVLVHYSTDYVFKGDNPSGYAEDVFIDPINKYGETKALGENLLKSNTDRYYLIRLSRLFGPIGESQTSKRSFVDVMLDLALNKGKKEFDLVDDEKSCPTYSKDLAQLTGYILENKLPFGIYHCANNGACTWYEFAKEIFKIKKLEVQCNPVPAAHFPRPAKRPRFSELINTKLPKQKSWQESLLSAMIEKQ